MQSDGLCNPLAPDCPFTEHECAGSCPLQEYGWRAVLPYPRLWFGIASAEGVRASRGKKAWCCVPATPARGHDPIGITHRKIGVVSQECRCCSHSRRSARRCRQGQRSCGRTRPNHILDCKTRPSRRGSRSSATSTGRNSRAVGSVRRSSRNSGFFQAARTRRCRAAIDSAAADMRTAHRLCLHATSHMPRAALRC
jgi:hypothetical protein